MNKIKFFKKKSLLSALLFSLLCLPALFPLLQKGFFTNDDGEWMIIRFSAFHQALRDGEVPVRFLSRLNQEFGYPVANFLYPGFMYLAEPFNIVGFGFVDSIKIILGFSIVFSGVFTYFWLRKFFDTFSSYIGALFYIYTPYHLYDLYKRGSIGELLALAVVPFILWQIERKSMVWSSVGIGLLILSHNTLAALFLPLIIAYMLLEIFISKNKKELIYWFGVVLIIGLGLSAFFWIPALFELKYTVFSQTTISDWRGYFADVALIGYSTILVLLVVAAQLISKQIVVKKHRLTFMMFSICLLALGLSTSFGSQLWNVLPVNFVQFPFRLLSVVIVCIAFLVACSISVLKGNKKYFLGTVFVLVLSVSAFSFLKPTESFDKGDGYYSTNMATTTIMDEYMPVWVKEQPLQRAEKKVEILKGEGNIQNLFYNSKKVSFIAEVKKESIVRVNTLYWPGWRAFVDGKEVTISYNNKHGVMDIAVPKGNHSVEVLFGETPLRLFADGISLVSLLLLIYLVVIPGRKPGIHSLVN